MTEPEQIECQDCEGSGTDHNWVGCSDPDCCGTNVCWNCGGEGMVDKDE